MVKEHIIGYNTQFEIGDFYVFSITMRYPRRRTVASNALFLCSWSSMTESYMVSPSCSPSSLLLYFSYRDHNLAFQIITDLIPDLKKKMFVGTSDDEFTKLLIEHFTGAFIAKCKNHVTNKIERKLYSKGLMRFDDMLGNIHMIYMYEVDMRGGLKISDKV